MVSSTGSRAMQGLRGVNYFAYSIQSSVQNQNQHHGLHTLQTLSLIYSSSPGAGVVGGGNNAYLFGFCKLNWVSLLSCGFFLCGTSGI